MPSLEMTEEQFRAQSLRRGRKYSSLLLLLSTACYFGTHMLIDTSHDNAMTLAWASVGFAISAFLMLVVVMPLHSILRSRNTSTS